MFISSVLRVIYLRRSLFVLYGSFVYICGKVGYVSVLGGRVVFFFG